MMRRHGCRHGPGRERGRRILRGIRSSGPREPISPTTAVRPTAAAVQTPRRHPRRVPHLRGPRDGLPTDRGVRPVFCCQNMAGGLRSEANSGCSRGAPTEASEALPRRQGSIRPPSTQTSPVPARSETGLAAGPGPPPQYGPHLPPRRRLLPPRNSRSLSARGGRRLPHLPFGLVRRPDGPDRPGTGAREQGDSCFCRRH